MSTRMNKIYAAVDCVKIKHRVKSNDRPTLSFSRIIKSMLKAMIKYVPNAPGSQKAP